MNSVLWLILLMLGIIGWGKYVIEEYYRKKLMKLTPSETK